MPTAQAPAARGSARPGRKKTGQIGASGPVGRRGRDLLSIVRPSVPIPSPPRTPGAIGLMRPFLASATWHGLSESKTRRRRMGGYYFVLRCERYTELETREGRPARRAKRSNFPFQRQGLNASSLPRYLTCLSRRQLVLFSQAARACCTARYSVLRRA